MVEISYQIPTYENKPLGFIRIQIITSISKILIDGIFASQNNLDEKFTTTGDINSNFSYSVREAEMYQLVDIQYPFHNPDAPAIGIWSIVEKLGLLEMQYSD